MITRFCEARAASTQTMMNTAPMHPKPSSIALALLGHPGFLFIALLALAGVMERIAPRQIPTLGDAGAKHAAVAALFAVAIALFAWSFRTFRTHATSIEPGAAPSALITRGPFRWSRNPMYVALLLLSLSFALLTASVWFFAATAVLGALLDRIVIAREERVLGAHFGDEFGSYRRRVRRWLGPRRNE